VFIRKPGISIFPKRKENVLPYGWLNPEISDLETHIKTKKYYLYFKTVKSISICVNIQGRLFRVYPISKESFRENFQNLLV
jgi:hypothetical protein